MKKVLCARAKITTLLSYFVNKSNKIRCRGVDDRLHLTLLSINRLNQTEPATFSVLLFWAFFKGFKSLTISVFSV